MTEEDLIKQEMSEFHGKIGDKFECVERFHYSENEKSHQFELGEVFEAISLTEHGLVLKSETFEYEDLYDVAHEKGDNENEFYFFSTYFKNISNGTK